MLTGVQVGHTILAILRPDGRFPYLTLPPRGDRHLIKTPILRTALRDAPRRIWSKPFLVVPGPLGTLVRSGEYVMKPALRSPYPSESTIQDELSTALRDHQSGRLEQAARTYQSILTQLRITRTLCTCSAWSPSSKESLGGRSN